jgi:hypothetical protein
MTWVQRLAEVEKESVECQRNTAEEGAEEDLQTAAMLNETAKVSIPEVWCVVFARDACSSKASVQLQASPIGEGSNPHEYKKMQEYKVFRKMEYKNLNANKMRSSLLHSQEAVAAAETGGWFSWVSGPSSVPASDGEMELEKAAAEKNAAEVKVVMLAFCMCSTNTVLSVRKLKTMRVSVIRVQKNARRELNTVLLVLDRHCHIFASIFRVLLLHRRVHEKCWRKEDNVCVKNT